MKLNKTLLITSVAAAMGMSAMANAAEPDNAPLTSSVEINFTGTFQDTTCSVNIDNKSGESIDVYLGAYKTAAMTKANETTPAVPFKVNFSNCGAIQNASIVFSGQTDSTNSELFSVLGDNKDTVGIGINKENSQSTNYIKSGDKVIVPIKTGDASQEFFARYVKIGDQAVQPGTANATVTMDINYN